MNRFDLEQQLQSCWGTKDDIDLLIDSIKSGLLTKNNIVKALTGISQLHELRSERAFDTFSNLIHSGVITDNSEVY